MSTPHSRDLRLLAGAAGLSALGDFMAIFPLILHVQQRTGSPLAVSALIFALWGPVVLAAGVAGAIVDRFENRRILIVVSLIQAATVTAMLAGLDSLGALLPLMTVLGFGVAVSQPAEFALVPAAAGPGIDAARANGLMETVRSLGFTAGPLVGGALGAAGLLWLALALNAISFVVVAFAAVLLRARRQPERAPDTDDPVRAREGFAFLRREPDLKITLGGAVAALALFSISATAEPFFVTRVLGGGSLAYGVLLSSWTVGMAAGSAGLAHRVGRAHLAAGGLAAVVLQGLGIAGGALATVVWIALIGFSLGGVAHGVKNVLLRTLIHERAPEALRGRAFAAYNGARNGAELGALVLGGIVVGALGPRLALLVAGLGPAAIGVACLLLLIKRRHRAAAVITNEGRVLHAHIQG
ncbi:MAG TPA: MFS transporter [Solirubrobacteraceae bacterium]|jgi:MFS family permease